MSEVGAKPDVPAAWLELLLLDTSGLESLPGISRVVPLHSGHSSTGVGRINHPFSTFIQKIFALASILFGPEHRVPEWRCGDERRQSR